MPLDSNLYQQLTQLEAKGVISRVVHLITWCVGMVVVPNNDGLIQICVDYKLLNQTV